MKTYKELKAQLNVCYDVSIYLSAQNDLTKEQIQKYISLKIDILLNELKVARENETIFKSREN